MILKARDLNGIGIQEYGLISTEEIPFEQEIREICEENACRLYGKTWACPPAVGTIIRTGKTSAEPVPAFAQ